MHLAHPTPFVHVRNRSLKLQMPSKCRRGAVTHSGIRWWEWWAEIGNRPGLEARHSPPNVLSLGEAQANLTHMQDFLLGLIAAANHRHCLSRLTCACISNVL